jgi:hypothetical protein
MLERLWNRSKDFYETIFITIPNRYAGIVLLIMLLVIFFNS